MLVPTWTDGVHVPWQRNILYPAKPDVVWPDTVGSVEAVHERLIWDEETAVPVSPVGTDGGVVSDKGAGVTEFDAADAFPVPTLFVAVTVNVYGVPLVRPVTVIGEAVPVPVWLPVLEVTDQPFRRQFVLGDYRVF